MTDKLVHLTVDRGIATITLDSPANRNALSAQLVAELDSHVRSALDDAGVRALHLTATGTVFCAGADLKAGGGPLTGALPAVLQALMDSPKPSVAELNGSVRAGGIGLVAACDISVAPATATFAFTEVRIGVVPAIVAVPVARRATRAAMARWFLTGGVFDATEAAATGLVSLAVDADQVRPVTAAILDELRLAAPGALAAVKPMLAGVEGRDVAAGLAWAAEQSAARFASEEAAEGMAAFRERRPPRWAVTGD